MKKKISFLLFLCLSQFSIAQQSFGNINKEYKWRVSFTYNSVDAQLNQALLNSWYYPVSDFYGFFGNKKDNSYSISINPEMLLKNDLFVRSEIGITSFNLAKTFNGINDSNSFGANTKASETISQNVYRFSFGLGTTIFSKKRIEGYTGAFLNFNSYDKMQWHAFVEDNNIPGRANEYNSDTEGGIALGIGCISGLRFYVTKSISIGSELSCSVMYYNIGGKQEGIVTGYYPASSTSYTYFLMNDNQSVGVQFFKPMPSVNIAFRF